MARAQRRRPRVAGPELRGPRRRFGRGSGIRVPALARWVSQNAGSVTFANVPVQHFWDGAAAAIGLQALCPPHGGVAGRDQLPDHRVAGGPGVDVAPAAEPVQRAKGGDRCRDRAVGPGLHGPAQ